jgi:hypothetical protein
MRINIYPHKVYKLNYEAIAPKKQTISGKAYAVQNFQ